MEEEIKGRPVRKYRGKATVLRILQDQADSGLTVKAFCSTHGIAEGSFHRWRQKYNGEPKAAPVGFTALKIIPEPGLFATVGAIKIYQPVSAAYLKELLS